MFDLNKKIFRLLFEEPFFATVSQSIDKFETKTETKTLGVRFNTVGQKFELYYNPDFLEKFSDKIIKGLLMHEFYHILLGHVTDRVDRTDPNRWNICTDLSINCNIPRDCLPKNGFFPGEGLFRDVPSHKSAEWYMENIPEKVFKKAVQMWGKQPEHKWDDDMSPYVKENANKKIEDMVNEGRNACERQKKWG